MPSLPLSHASGDARTVADLLQAGGKLLSWEARRFAAGIPGTGPRARAFFGHLDFVFAFLGAPYFGGRIALVFSPAVEDRGNPGDRASPWDTGGMAEHAPVADPAWSPARQMLVKDWSFPLPDYRRVAEEYIASYFDSIWAYVEGKAHARPDLLGAMAAGDPLTRTWEVRFKRDLDLRGAALKLIIAPDQPMFTHRLQAWTAGRGIDLRHYPRSRGGPTPSQLLVKEFVEWMRSRGM